MPGGSYITFAAVQKLYIFQLFMRVSFQLSFTLHESLPGEGRRREKCFHCNWGLCVLRQWWLRSTDPSPLWYVENQIQTVTATTATTAIYIYISRYMMWRYGEREREGMREWKESPIPRHHPYFNESSDFRREHPGGEENWTAEARLEAGTPWKFNIATPWKYTGTSKERDRLLS